MNQLPADKLLPNTSLTVAITPDDKLVFDSSSSDQSDVVAQAAPSNDQSLTLAASNQQRTIEMFSNLYKTDVSRALSHDDTLLSDFAPLRNSQHKDIYDSLLRLFKSADHLTSLINKMKILHSDVLTELRFLQGRLGDKYELLLQALYREAENSDGNGRLFENVLRSADFGRYVKNCDDRIREIKELNDTIRDVFDFREEREHLTQILGNENTRDVLDNFDADIEEKAILVSSYEQERSKILPEKLRIDNEFNFNRLKMEQIDQLIAKQEQLEHDLSQNKKKLEESKWENEEKKNQILSKTIDPSQLENILNEETKICKDFESKYAQSLLEINEKANNLTNEIAEVKEVQKNFHLLFVLDESGSMKPYFDSVKESVYKVIEQRRKQPVVKEKVSVIRFHTKARIDILNADVTEKIEIVGFSSGDTKFIPALAKLGEVLDEINSDLYMPIVFFLSDGFGEPQAQVLAKCHELKNKFSNMSMLFFCIGYGDAADAETLEAMTAVFNNSKTILSVGEEKCKLYYTVRNQNELLRSFLVYEKLFNYQRNILKTKSEMYKGLLKQTDVMNDQTNQCLKKMFEMQRQHRESQEKESQAKVVGIDNINKRIDETIAIVSQQIETVKVTIDKLNAEKKKHNDALASISGTKVELEDKLKAVQSYLDESQQLLDSFREKKNRQSAEMIKNIEENKEADYQRCLKQLNNLNLNVSDSRNFKIRFTRFTQNYYKFKYELENLEVKSMAIVDELKIVIEKIRNVEEDMLSFKEVNNENLKSKIWSLVVYYYETNFRIVTILNEEKGDKVSDEDVFLAICRKRLNLSNADEKAINLILQEGSLTPQVLFSKMEEEPKFAETFISKYIANKIKMKVFIKDTEINEIKSNKSLSDQEKEQKSKLIKDDIEKLTQYKIQFEINSFYIERILEDLNEARKMVKEFYVKSYFNRIFKRKFLEIKDNVLPEIKQLQIAYEKSSN